MSDGDDLSNWPEDSPLIVRREPLHPGGSQHSLFSDFDYRYRRDYNMNSQYGAHGKRTSVGSAETSTKRHRLQLA